MPKQIKLTDRVAEELERRAQEDNLSLAGEVAKLLSASELSSPVDTSYFDKRFDELKALIEDTTVDRIDSRPARPRYSSSRVNRIVPWECIQDVYFDFPEGEVWLAGARENWGNSDCIDMATFYVNGDEIWSDFYGAKTPMLKITPELVEYLHKKGFDI